MTGNNVSENGNSIAGVSKLKGTALKEAIGWADAILDAEFRGRGDREKSVIHRVSKLTGISESYLRRLKYRSEEMKDVAGSVYRSLKITYDELCQRNEDAAARHRAERLAMGEDHEASDEKRDTAPMGMAPAALEATKEAEG